VGDDRPDDSWYDALDRIPRPKGLTAMGFTFKDVKNFMRLRDPSIGIEPHYSEDSTFDSVGVRLTPEGVFKMIGLKTTVEDTVDSIFTQVSELRSRSA
jgi:hypothetical protein